MTRLEEMVALYEAHPVVVNPPRNGYRWVRTFRAVDPKRLTPTEVRVCDVLRGAPGVVTLPEMGEKALSYTYGVDKVLKVHVYNIREKLGRGCIETVRGKGLRWAP